MIKLTSSTKRFQSFCLIAGAISAVDTDDHLRRGLGAHDMQAFASKEIRAKISTRVSSS